jgi:hypothetical protein
MVGGRPPFGDTASWTVVSAVLERDPQPLGQFVDGVPVSLERVVMTCLSKTPTTRYPEARAIVTALEPVLEELVASGRPVVARPATTTGPAEPSDAASGRWWFQVHQLTASVVLALLMIPAWKLMSRLPRLQGRLLVMALLILAAGIGTMRLHLWFTAGHGGTGLAREIIRGALLLRWGNRVFALLLGLGGAAVADQSPELAAVCLACAAGNLVAAEVIEPATVERALGRSA